MYKVALIGLGRQNISDNLPAIIKNKKLKIDSFCDINKDLVSQFTSLYGGLGFTDVETMLKETKPDIAFVAVPHNAHYKISKMLVLKGVNIFKEKPFAVKKADALDLQRLAKQNNIVFYNTAQRRFRKIFQIAKEKLNTLGDLYSADILYTMNIEKLDKGWRAKKENCLGGALMDMGYHYIDILLWFFGLPNRTFSMSSGLNRLDQDYDTEDTVKLIFEYCNKITPSRKNLVSFTVSRTYPKKGESLTIMGTNGVIELTKKTLKIFDTKGNILESYEAEERENISEKQIDYFVNLLETSTKNNYCGSPEEHIQHVSLIEEIYNANNL